MLLQNFTNLLNNYLISLHIKPMGMTELPAAKPQVIDGEFRPIADAPPPEKQDALHLLTCLLVGGGLEVADLLLDHARAWQARYAASPRLLPLADEPTAADLVRYALIGLIFDSEQRVRDNMAWWGNQVLRSVGMATTMTRPLTDHWLMAPLQRPLRSLSRQMHSDLAQLIGRGRVEEGMSRVMASELGDELVTVILNYLSDKPEVRRLIQEQGVSLVGEVVDEMRDQSAAVDDYVESFVRRLFNQAPRQSSPPPDSNS